MKVRKINPLFLYVLLFRLTCFSLCSFRSERDNMNRNEKISIIYVEVNVDEISELNIHENNFATE